MKRRVFQETATAVARRFGVSVKALRVYEDAGLLKPARTMAGWRIYQAPELERLSAILALKQLGLPLIGMVAAGSPILAVENVQGRYALDAQLFNPRADYLLKVRGLSMIDAGIFEGDLLAVHKTSEARDGQIVIARVAEDVTVKRLKRRNGLIELIAENPDFEPIIVNPAEVEFAIEGIAVGLIRGAISTLS